MTVVASDTVPSGDSIAEGGVIFDDGTEGGGLVSLVHSLNWSFRYSNHILLEGLLTEPFFTNETSFKERYTGTVQMDSLDVDLELKIFFSIPDPGGRYQLVISDGTTSFTTASTAVTSGDYLQTLEIRKADISSLSPGEITFTLYTKVISTLDLLGCMGAMICYGSRALDESVFDIEPIDDDFISADAPIDSFAGYLLRNRIEDIKEAFSARCGKWYPIDHSWDGDGFGVPVTLSSPVWVADGPYTAKAGLSDTIEITVRLRNGNCYESSSTYNNGVWVSVMVEDESLDVALSSGRVQQTSTSSTDDDVLVFTVPARTDMVRFYVLVRSELEDDLEGPLEDVFSEVHEGNGLWLSETGWITVNGLVGSGLKDNSMMCNMSVEFIEKTEYGDTFSDEVPVYNYKACVFDEHGSYQRAKLGRPYTANGLPMIEAEGIGFEVNYRPINYVVLCSVFYREEYEQEDARVWDPNGYPSSSAAIELIREWTSALRQIAPVLSIRNHGTCGGPRSRYSWIYEDPKYGWVNIPINENVGDRKNYTNGQWLLSQLRTLKVDAAGLVDDAWGEWTCAQNSPVITSVPWSLNPMQTEGGSAIAGGVTIEIFFRMYFKRDLEKCLFEAIVVGIDPSSSIDDEYGVNDNPCETGFSAPIRKIVEKENSVTNMAQTKENYTRYNQASFASAYKVLTTTIESTCGAYNNQVSHPGDVSLRSRQVVQWMSVRLHITADELLNAKAYGKDLLIVRLREINQLASETQERYADSQLIVGGAFCHME